MRKKRSSPGTGLLVLEFILFLLMFLLPAVREGDPRFYGLAVVFPGFLLVSGLLFPALLKTDRTLLSLAHFLAGLFLLTTVLISPDLLLSRVLALAAGYVGLILCQGFSRGIPETMPLSAAAALAALLALALPLIPGLSLHTGLPACGLLLVSLSVLLVRRRLLAAVLILLPALVLLLLQSDWASALCLALTVSLLAWTSSGSWLILLASLLLFGGSLWGVISLLPRLNPASLPFISPQITSAALSGGLFGTGPGLGSVLEASDLSSVLPLAAVAEQFGSVFLCCMILLFTALLLRGVSVASAARKGAPALQAMGIVLFLGLQGALTLAACLGLVPLTVSGFPLLSPDFLSEAAALSMVGILAGIECRNRADLEEDSHLAMLAH